ncbi:MAG: hypothetical protein ABIR30_05080 [Chitinophagaceae bacterium]
MKHIIPLRSLCIFLLSALVVIYSCSKGGGGGTPPNPCSGVTVTVSGTTSNPTTVNGTDGSISATASGASGFTYSLNGGTFQASGTFSNLAAGSYTIVAKSSAGCTGSSIFTLSAPNPCAGINIIVTGTATNPSGPGATNGSIVASATGSTGFTYSINGGAFQPSGTFNNLGAGAYAIVAKDLNGCIGSANFTLTAPNPCAGITIVVTGTITHPSAPGATNGSIVASATGSTGFTYNINGGVFQASGTFNNLGAGVYIIVAKDLNGCTGTNSFTLTPPNPCAGVNIIVSITPTANIPCQLPNTGAIAASASGGNGVYTYSLNGGAFQSSGTFSNLPAGNYTVTAKDGNTCTGSGSDVVSNAPAGPLFTQVRTVLQNNCVPCHNNVQQEGGMNWTIDCNIVTFKDRIQARAVNGNPSPMPPTGLLPISERQKITNWINAGGRYSD